MSPFPQPPEWIVSFDDAESLASLEALLRHDLLQEQASQGNESRISFLVARVDGLKVEVFAKEHSPPHFRVSCNGETANYRISDCGQLNGALQQHYRSIRTWHGDNKEIIIQAWNRMRPTDCPVGEYRA